MVSRTSEHALRAILYLAQHVGQGPVRAESIAEALGAPRNYLSKTLHQLAKQGLVHGTRGPHGGFVLAVPAAELSVARVVASFEDEGPAPMCLLGGRRCDAAAPCTAHRRWTAIQHAARRPLHSTTIADLLAPQRPTALPASHAAAALATA